MRVMNSFAILVLNRGIDQSWNSLYNIYISNEKTCEENEEIRQLKEPTLVTITIRVKTYFLLQMCVWQVNIITCLDHSLISLPEIQAHRI